MKTMITETESTISVAPTATKDLPEPEAATSEQENRRNELALKEEHWASKWRAWMAWQYMLTCCCDFIIFPILWSVFQAIHHGTVTAQWAPITLQGGGLYHLAMGAILGVAAFGKTKEITAGFRQ